MTSHFDRLAKSLSATYRLKSTLGSGGAAHVYVAEELKTGRRVAIKVLREEQATSISVSRFLAEIRIAAELEHPNIVPVYSSGTAGGLPYYVMPFIEGQSLRTRLTSAGRLPLAEVLCISADISAALDYAHQRDARSLSTSGSRWPSTRSSTRDARCPDRSPARRTT